MLKQICLYLSIFCIGSIKAQSIEDRLVQSEEHYSQNQQEKIYVHTDRNSYTAGETFWYKTYNTLGISNLLSVLSGINYIELVDPKNRIVADQRIQLGFGLAAGSLTLADSLIEGSYRLRAYTNWMRNFPSDSHFEKTLIITNGRTDNTQTHTTLQTIGGDNYIAVTIKSLSGNPLSKIKVNYLVTEEEKVIHRGNERTDEQGLLLIKLTEKIKDKDIQLSFTNLDRRPVSKVIHATAIKPQSSIQILPEGGKILAGELNNLGIKAVSTNGLGVKARVEISNSKQEIISTAETNDLGMGSISFFPMKDESYTFSASVAGEDIQQITPPTIESTGMSIIVNNQNPKQLFAQVNVSDDQLSEDVLYLVLHHLGNPIYASRQKKNQKNIVFNVAKALLPSGVITLSILDARFQPVLERPIFLLQQQRLIPLDIAVPKQTFGLREKVSVDISTGAATDSTQLASLSAAVVHLGKQQDTIDHNTNIYSSLLLEADLQGYVESPGYYFSAGDRIAKMSDLDKLMLTQGWRKYDWKENQDTVKEYEAEEGLQVKGFIKKLGRKAVVPDSEVQLLTTGNALGYLDTITNEAGFFHFKNILFPDSTKFLISAKDQNGKNNVDIVLENLDPPTIARMNGSKNDVNALYIDELISSKQFFHELEQKGLMPNTIEIEEVVVTRTVDKVPEHSRNLNGRGQADQILTWEEIERFPTLEFGLNGRLTGVYFQQGIPYSMRSRGPMQVVIDGMYVEGDILSTISTMDVASIEVLRNINYTAIYGSMGSNGVIVVTTKTGKEGGNQYTPKGILSFTAKGISAAKEFYKPTYEVDSEKMFTRDLRATIHWEPFLATDKDGKARFDFYTSDEPGTYRIVLEGIDLTGRIGRKLVDIQVKN